MKASQWHRAVEKCPLEGSPTGPVTVVLVADGPMWLVC